MEASYTHMCMYTKGRRPQAYACIHSWFSSLMPTTPGPSTVNQCAMGFSSSASTFIWGNTMPLFVLFRRSPLSYYLPFFSCPLLTIVAPNLQRPHLFLLPTPDLTLPILSFSFLYHLNDSGSWLEGMRAGPGIYLCWRKQKGKHFEQRLSYVRELVSGNHNNLGNHEVIFSRICDSAILSPSSKESCLHPPFCPNSFLLQRLYVLV